MYLRKSILLSLLFSTTVVHAADFVESMTGFNTNHTPILQHNSINAGVVNGWDNFDENLSNWNFLGNISWSDDDEVSSVVLSLITGDTDDITSENRTMYSLVATHHFNEQLHYIFQHDFGFQERARANN